METTTHYTTNSSSNQSNQQPATSPAGVSPADTGETIRQRINSAQTQIDAVHQRLGAAEQKLGAIQQRIDAVLKDAWAKLRARQQPTFHTPAVAVIPEGPLYRFA